MVRVINPDVANQLQWRTQCALEQSTLKIHLTQQNPQALAALSPTHSREDGDRVNENHTHLLYVFIRYWPLPCNNSRLCAGSLILDII